MAVFVPGQRWLSEAESELGLGTVIRADKRQVTLVFFADGSTRIYACESAPLSRVIFSAGDTVQRHDGSNLTLTEVNESGGLISYRGILEDGSDVTVQEGELHHEIKLDSPMQRLTRQLWSPLGLFELRQNAYLHLDRHARSPVRGLLGARIEVLPHQLHVAARATELPVPRALLADEVGLGKTIEAGLIAHRLHQQERAKRILIAVPQALTVQWFVEMLRRFNMHFHLFDDSRITALSASSQEENPFDSEQLCLCALEDLRQTTPLSLAACAVDWDLVILDEAHKVAWQDESSALLRRLGSQSRGLLLLSATPEQAGTETHFAQLQLLDPERYSNFQRYCEQASQFPLVEQCIEALQVGTPLPDEAAAWLARQFPEANWQPTQMDEGARRDAVARLLDFEGTGRSMFRNRRAHVEGFPERRYHPTLVADGPADFSRNDPRMAWLSEHLNAHLEAKVLLIAHRSDDALLITQTLRQLGHNSTAFHEHLSLIERDRAAAWFAQEEDGAQIMCCSEIGSEGRNFQFAQHLILIDLPDNPDALEQRIGRLDRIGQRNDVHIYTPCFPNGRDAALAKWYDEGFNAFEAPNDVGHAVAQQIAEAWQATFAGESVDSATLNTLIDATQQQVATQRQQRAEGRDALLARNTCQSAEALAWAEAVQAWDDDNTPLEQFLDQAFDHCMIVHEAQSDGSMILQADYTAGSHGLSSLPDEGLTVTLRRDVAVRREDIQFLTWEHPMLSELMEQILRNEAQAICAGILDDPMLPANVTVCECLYTLVAPDDVPAALWSLTPPVAMRRAYAHGIELSDEMDTAWFSQRIEHVPERNVARKVKRRANVINHLLESGQREAQTTIDAGRPALLQAIQTYTDAELARVQHLPKGQTTQASIDMLHEQHRTLTHAAEHMYYRLDALRVLMTW